MAETTRIKALETELRSLKWERDRQATVAGIVASMVDVDPSILSDPRVVGWGLVDALRAAGYLLDGRAHDEVPG